VHQKISYAGHKIECARPGACRARLGDSVRMACWPAVGADACDREPEEENDLHLLEVQQQTWHTLELFSIDQWAEIRCDKQTKIKTLTLHIGWY
jgi:hypothetical protein